MDDVIIICNEKEKLQRLLVEIKEKCNKIGLEVNPNKTRIYKLREGFTYLGFRFILLNTGKIVMKIPNSKKGRLRRYLKSKSEIERRKSIVFYKDYLMKGNNYCFYKRIM